MKEPEITSSLIEQHGLSVDEYNRILNILDREPSFTELGVFSAMWNEHCSYKSSKKWLRMLPISGPHVICGPGENAGIIDIGDNQALVFKMESHNHPSFIEPYQGAATGVGGILRDIFTMGARPIAVMNSLSFGEISHSKTKQLVNGVVAGIGGYGNAFGVPCVGGEIRFHPAYNGNCLVNVFAAGLIDVKKIFYAAASGVGMPIVYLGAKTGRDGVGGASMASSSFDDQSDQKKQTVQIGDPFTEKCLMEACFELMQTGAVISIQDMGAAGLTCSAVEMGDKGKLGMSLNLDYVPQREQNMTAYEMMLSESQERMLMVLRPEQEVRAQEIFEKWDLDFAIIGETISDDRFIVRHHGKIKANIPLSPLAGNAPEYDRPWTESIPIEPLYDVPKIDPIDALKSLIISPNYASKHWVYQQYDTMVMGDTVRPPRLGAGLIRVHGTEKILAFSTDVTPRYVKANPKEGGRQAVAETFRNLVATGATPLAATDNLNFGNPEKTEIMGQFVYAIQGISEACKHLNLPIVSGNVSLYNETDDQAILPTPTIGGVGLISCAEDVIGIDVFEDQLALVIGNTVGHLGQSAVLAEVFNRQDGEAPAIDLEAELKHGHFILENRSLIGACTNISDGGLALAVFKLAQSSNIGVSLYSDDMSFLFGEDQGRYLIASTFDQAEALVVAATHADVPIQTVGRFAGCEVALGDVSISLEPLSDLFHNSFSYAFS
ncbi:MAG: phosphoribosylformylglycinamidine synthase subunit PurL [Aestuariivita sp.]|nr:phosphoribosylformylglycinamidine synthase subunit PurL [Aestuariivita sp.]